MLAVAVACACGVPPESEPAPDPTIDIEVGDHPIRVLVPEGWQHHDRGREHHFEQGSAYLAVTDLGPVTRAGLVAALRQSRSLHDAGQPADARVALADVEPRWFFTTKDRWYAVRSAWKVLTEEPVNEPHEPRVVESAYRFVLAQAEALVDRDFADIAHSYLEDFGHTSQRDVALEAAAAVSGRPALRIDTWDRLTHLWKRQHLFVLNEGRLLCLRTELGDTDLLEPAFSSLADSMAYRDASASSLGS